MTWTIQLKSTNPASLNAITSSSVDVPFMASNTDGRTASKIVTRADWTVPVAQYEAQMFLADLLAKDAAIAKATPNVATINNYINTNPVLATG